MACPLIMLRKVKTYFYNSIEVVKDKTYARFDIHSNFSIKNANRKINVLYMMEGNTQVYLVFTVLDSKNNL
jgi:hypothetical protein